MTYRLKNPLMVLNKYYLTIDSNRRIQAPSMEALHQQALRIDPEHIPASLADFRVIVMDEMCPDLPKGMCSGGPEDLKVNRSTFPQMKSWMKAAREVIAAALSGNKVFVSQIEAERRAAICVGCVANYSGGTCLSCTGFSAASRVILKGRKTKYDGLLDTCRRCGCIIKTKVHIDSELLDKIDAKNGLDVDEYEPRCWRRSERDG